MFCSKWSDTGRAGQRQRCTRRPLSASVIPSVVRPSVHLSCASFATRHELGISHATHSASVRPLFRRQRRRRVKRASGPQPRAGGQGREERRGHCVTAFVTSFTRRR